MTIYTLFLYIAIAAIGLLLTLGVGHAKLKKYQVMHPVLWFFQYFVGSLLIFSGLVKAVDPLGTAYKMADYFTLLLPMLSFMKPYALPFALVMIVLEIVLGINLILGIGKKMMSSLILLMMLFFTFLTGYNYLTAYLPENVGIFDFGSWSAFNKHQIKVSDCGCFGDFLKLLPIETFLKDVFLTAVSFWIYLKTSQLKELFASTTKLGPINLRSLLTGVFTVGTTVFCFMNFYFGLPMVDFRPFRIGVNIPTARMECEKDAPVVLNTFVYKHKESGKEVSVTSDEIAKEEFAYLYKEKDADGNKFWEAQKDKTVEKKIKDGCDSKIKEMDASKQKVFATHGYSFLVVADDLSHSSSEGFKKLAKIAELAHKDGIETHAMYYHIPDANADRNYEDDLEKFRHEHQTAFEFIQADEKLVKTIIRSSPGLLLLYNGTVVNKWHHRQLPSYEQIKAKYMQSAEPTLVLRLAAPHDYVPGSTIHTFYAAVKEKVKGSYEDAEMMLSILDGNDALIKLMTSDITDTGATLSNLEISFINNPALVSKNKDINIVPNGVMDKSRNAWQIVSIKKLD